MRVWIDQLSNGKWRLLFERHRVTTFCVRSTTLYKDEDTARKAAKCSPYDFTEGKCPFPVDGDPPPEPTTNRELVKKAIGEHATKQLLAGDPVPRVASKKKRNRVYDKRKTEQRHIVDVLNEGDS